MLCMQTNVVMFYCSHVLLLLRAKFLEFTPLIMIDALCHHSVMVSVLHSQRMFWHTDLNPFNTLCHKNVFWHADPILSFTKSSKAPLVACRCKSSLQCLPLDHVKVAWLHFCKQESFAKILVLALTWLCLKWRLWMIDVTVKKTDKIKHDQFLRLKLD